MEKCNTREKRTRALVGDGSVTCRKGAVGLEANVRQNLVMGMRNCWCNERGQGTTEYAILVGVLVVIAIVAIVAFRGKVAELWQAISDGINSL